MRPFHMETITFYSYKGGVGRTLALANIAIYLSRFGLNVCIMDFDLEAPGLHYKFPDRIKTSDIGIGLVDYISDFIAGKSTSKSFKDMATQIISSSGNQGRIDLIPAGNVLSPSYWQKLASIDWHYLFYREESEGIPFFFDLKEKIKKQINPDFLLIDSRTGITEMSGLCTSLLADKVVFLFTNNRENIDGARQIIHSINKSSFVPGKEAPKIICALTRIPINEGDENKEQQIIQNVQNVLNLPTDICVLHSDRDLELSESLRINQSGLAKDVPLIRDYLRLFSKIISSDIITPKLDSILNEIIDTANLLDNPDKTQLELEGLVSSYLHPKSLEKLIDLYILRKESLEKILDAFHTLNDTYGINEQKTLRKYVSLFQKTESDYQRSELFDTQIIENYLNLNTKDKNLTELLLANAYSASSDNELAMKHYNNLISDNTIDKVELFENMLDIYLEDEMCEKGNDLYEKYPDVFESNIDLKIKLIEIFNNLGNISKLSKLIEDKAVDNKLFNTDARLYFDVLDTLGRTDEIGIKMENALERAIESSNGRAVYEMGQVFYDMGKSEVFDKKTAGRVRDREEILSSLRRRYRRY